MVHTSAGSPGSGTFENYRNLHWLAHVSSVGAHECCQRCPEPRVPHCRLQKLTGKTTTGWEPLDKISNLRQSQSGPPKNLLKFLWGTGSHWQATERRDMIYAFLGLLNQPALFEPLGFQITPDYLTPLRECYISLARTVIEGSRNLDLFAEISAHEVRYTSNTWYT